MNAPVRPSATLGAPVVDPACWSAADLARDQGWLHVLSPDELASLRAMARSVRARIGDDPNGLIGLGAEAFDLGAFAPTLAAIRDRLRDGLGLAVVRGLPMDALDRLEAATIYWGIGRHLGTARSNNPEGDLLGHVTDLGKSQDDPRSRGYQTREAMDYHCDQCAVVGLLCVRDARSGGDSKVASSIAVYNELLRRDPAAVRVLAEPLCWTKHGEVDPGSRGWYESPVFAVLDGRLCTSFGPRHILKGHALPGAPPISDAQRDAIALAERIAEELHYAMRMRPGDIQLLNNYVVLHTRTAYVDWDEPGRKRLMWRLWLSVPQLRPATAYVREWDAGVRRADTRERIVL